MYLRARARATATRLSVREPGGAPRNPAPRNYFLAWIVEPSGCQCTDALGGNKCRRAPTPLRSTSPFSDLGSVSREASEPQARRRSAAVVRRAMVDEAAMGTGGGFSGWERSEHLCLRIAGRAGVLS